MSDLTVITVTHNSSSLLPSFVESLQHSQDVRWNLVVVDSGSSDNSTEVARELGARVLELPQNSGYAAGINFAIERAMPAGPIAVLNPDIRVTPEMFLRLLGTLNEEVGIAVPQLRNNDGTLAHSIRRDPTVARGWGEAVLGGGRAGRMPHWGEVEQRDEVYTDERDVDWATGAALIISEACWRRVGKWDESFFLYGEEVDFCQRARRMGFRIRYDPLAIAIHEGGDVMVNPTLWTILTVNRVRLYARQHGSLATAAYWTSMATNELLRVSSPIHRRALRALISKRFWPEELQSPTGI